MLEHGADYFAIDGVIFGDEHAGRFILKWRRGKALLYWFGSRQTERGFGFWQLVSYRGDELPSSNRRSHHQIERRRLGRIDRRALQADKLNWRGLLVEEFAQLAGGFEDRGSKGLRENDTSGLGRVFNVVD